MRCAGCGHENREGARFCSGCGDALSAPASTCASCGTENVAGARFCDACGHPLGERPEPEPRSYTPDHLVERILEHRAAVEGERKQVTVLFADVSGSMDLAESVDAEVLREIMDRFFARLCEGVHRYEGTVVQFTGDGIMALFGAPIAHEDHAARAGWAALHLRRDLSQYAAELRRERGLSFSVRMGINSGEVVVGSIGEDLRVDYTAIGQTVGLAQRMESLAAPGTVYVTDRSEALLRGFFELAELGPHAVKGVREPVGVFELTGAGAARSRLDIARERGLSRFVGRDEEIGVLEAALARALDGEGQVVGVVGEPGVGKSRLCDEFIERCRARGLYVFAAACQSHARNVPFHAALEMMRGYLGIGEDDAPQDARERVAGRLLLMSPAVAGELPLLFDFLGIPDPARPAPRMDPGARQRRLLELVRRISHAHGEREPAVTLIEDAHWIDEGSAVFLDALVDAATATRALIVVNFRPEFRAQWMAGTHYRQLPVVPLGGAAIDALIAYLLGDDASLNGLPEAIRQRTGGNPFFIEELVSGLVEDGTLEGARGSYRLARPIADVAVPPTVHAVLAARIDRLGERDKGLLQAAAVLGKEFGEPVLERVAEMSGPELAAALRGLVAADFLYERALYPEAQYAFRHPLTQEVAYGSQLAERRRRVHSAVAQAMTELYPDRLDELAALIAHHCEQAGEQRDAARWHARSAAWSGVNDIAAALAHWERVRELAAALPEDAETIALGLAARTWQLQIGWRLGSSLADIDAAFADARAMAERVGDAGSQALLLGMYAGAVGLTRSMTESEARAREAMELARQAGNPTVEQAVSPFLAYALTVSGRFEEARAQCERTLAIAAEHPSAGVGMTVGSPEAWARMMRGFISSIEGDPGAAARDFAAGLEAAARDGDLETRGWLYQNHGSIALVTGTLEGVPAQVARAAEIAGSIGSPFSRIWAGFNVGLVATMQGEDEHAVRVLEEAEELSLASRTGQEALPWTLATLAGARARLGDGEAGRAAAERAIALATERGYRIALPFARRILAELLGPGPEATALLDAALQDARDMGMRGEEALVQLARADLCGDAAALREAARLFELNGADGHLEAIAPRLQALAAA